MGSNSSIVDTGIEATDLNTEEESREKVFKHGFTLTELYNMALVFYKKNKNSLHVTYQEKVDLVAYYKQITCGRFDQAHVPEVGYFDVIGNDRKKAWQALGGMAPDVAKEKFFDVVENNSSDFVQTVTNKRAEIDAEIERKRLKEEERKRREEEERERLRLEELERKRKEEEERLRKEEE